MKPSTQTIADAKKLMPEEAPEAAIFLEAIGLKPEARVEFVDRVCGDDANLRQRVLALLDAHQDEDEFLEQRPPGISTEEQQTIDFQPVASADAATARMQLAVRAEASSRANAAFGEATRRLLRSRLMVASVGLLGVEAIFTCYAVVTGHGGFEPLLRVLAAVALVSIYVYLRNHADLSATRLRWLEVAILAVPIVEVLALLVLQTERMVAEGGLADITSLRVLIGMATCVVISLYGMFVPSDWRRMALITGTAACLPTLTVYAHTLMSPTLQDSDVVRIGIAIPTFLLTAMVAAIATLGAHIVHRIRREVETARQYGQYELVERIGAGGMGVVYRARHRLLKRPAAIKLIRREVAADERMIECFEREVQISATLSHWNTVQIFDYGRSESGEFFYVMELLEGQTLHDLIRTKRSLTPVETVIIAQQICAGLEEAHAIGMVHRDLKPANVFLAEYGGKREVVKILDFGLAVQVTPSERPTTISGTPKYMSPEQIQGDVIDGRSDIYSVGCILFECLSGAAPFVEGTPQQVLDKHLAEPPPMDRLPDAASVLSPIVERCLSKKPQERFQSVAALTIALEQTTEAP